MSFTGEYRRTIDSKGRLIVPSQMRGEIEDETVTLVASPDGCVEMWSGEHWRAYEGKLLEQRRSSTVARSVTRRIAASARSDRIDRQGRLHIPDHLRDWARIDRDVWVVGHLDHAEIWSPSGWEEASLPQDQLRSGFEQLDL